MRSTNYCLIICLLAVVAGGLRAQVAGGGQDPVLVINETDADQTGTDMGEFVELYDGGTGNFSLNGLILVYYNGSNDTSYMTIDLTGFSTDTAGYFLVGNASVSPSIVTADNSMQNGADAVALYADVATNFPNGTPVTAVNLLDAVVYDTSDADAVGLISVLTPGQPQINEDGAGNGATDSIGRCQDGAGGPLVTTQWVTMVPTPGASNGNNCNPFVINVTQDVINCGPISIDVTGAAPVAELFNLFSFNCTFGGGLLFGVDVDAFPELFYPLGVQPFHVIADGVGAYNLTFQTPCAVSFSVEAVSLQFVGGVITEVSPPQICTNILL